MEVRVGAVDFYRFIPYYRLHSEFQIDLNGTLKDPNVSNWQALVEVVRNAFIKAILPGFDREVQTASAQPRTNNGTAER
jgi:hypothetical protein